MNPAAENILKLAVLAAVVDGQASDQEKNFIVDDGSHLLRTSPDKVRPFIDLHIGIYQSN